MKNNIHQQVTDTIVAQMEAGVESFQMPWQGPMASFMPSNFVTKKTYSGINILRLWVAAQKAGFANGFWATYRQWKDIGGQVKKGAKATRIIFYKTATRETVDDLTGETSEGGLRILKGFNVFNVDQVDGIDLPKPAIELVDRTQRNQRADDLIVATGARIEQGGNFAFYNAQRDVIIMPCREYFHGSNTSSATETYYSTIFHELGHWVGASHRLNRSYGKNKDDPKYAAEELVAELTAAFLCAELGFYNEPRPDHAAYLAEYLALLKNDPKAIFKAAAAASEAARYITDFSVKTSDKQAA